MRLAACGASVTGPSHCREGVPNQDALCVNGNSGGWCIAVADGLGSRKYSHIGSHTAVRLFRNMVRQQGELRDDVIFPALREAWLARFPDGYSLYETTCLWASVDKSGQGIAGQSGDGLILIKSNGLLTQLTKQREGFSNQTTTLSQSDLQGSYSAEFALKKPGDGVLLMTDGISDDLIPEQLEAFFEVVYRRHLQCSKRRMRKWLTAELHGWSTPLHGDDKTIAGIFRRD